MPSLTPGQRQHIIDLLEQGKGLPLDYKHLLFPPERQEYELVYAGKEREEDILADTMAVPLQPIKTFGANGGDSWHNMLIFGDNLQAMKSLLRLKDEGKLVNADGSHGVKLVYIDPPFATKQEFRGGQEERAYQDKIVGTKFLEFLRKRLIMLYNLLAHNGILVIHLDTRKGHYVKVILDEIFGEHNFRNAIVWKRSDAHSDVSQGATHLGKVYDTLFYYVKSANTKVNPVYTPLPQGTIDKWYRHIEEETGRRYNMGDASGPGGAKKGNPYYEWNGIKRYWRFSKERMIELEKEGRLAYSSSGVAYIKRYLDESKGVPIQDWWDDIPMLRGIHKNGETTSYPTQKPEQLLERVILALSDPNDLIIDAFAGSGTTLVVAEKLGRRWLGIDCGKLAIYTIQKRLFNLRREIGNKGKSLKPQPFTLYHAGLYDFSRLKRLPWADWRFFALHLFQCRDERHTLSGVELDGYRGAEHVLVFNHLLGGGVILDEGFVADLHRQIGSKVGSRFFIIAPAASVAFLEDYLELGHTRYYVLRIPYSIINELHTRDFEAISQPLDETQVNETVEAVGFDFIWPPEVACRYLIQSRPGELIDEAVIQFNTFKSKAMVKGATQKGNLETLSLVMVDYDYPSKAPDEAEPPPFEMDQVFYASDLAKDGWTVRLPLEMLGEQTMLIYLDIYGNEFREVKSLAEFARE